MSNVIICITMVEAHQLPAFFEEFDVDCQSVPSGSYDKDGNDLHYVRVEASVWSYNTFKRMSAGIKMVWRHIEDGTRSSMYDDYNRMFVDLHGSYDGGDL